MRKQKQTHTKTTTKHNHQPAATRKNRAPKVYVSPALSTRSRRRSPGVIEQRKAYGGVAKCEGMPDHQNHHHVATGAKKVSRQAVNRRSELPTDTVRHQPHNSEKGRYKMAQYPRGKARPARAPWWSASGDLLARTMDARPAQGTPWWSASGAAPSNRHNLWLYYRSPAKVIVHN